MAPLAWFGRHRRALLFFSWAAALLALLKLDLYRTFVRPEFGVILTAAYVLLLFLLSSEMGRKDRTPFHGSLFLAPTILLIPLLFLLHAQGAKLDSYVFEKRSLGTPRLQETESPATDAGPEAPNDAPSPVFSTAKGPLNEPASVSVTHLDLYQSPNRYQGRRISLIGMTYRNEAARKEFGDNALLVFRFVVACCAADAQPISVLIQSKHGPADLPDNTWVKVEGRFTMRSLKGDKVPVIEEASLARTLEPKTPYLY